MFRNIRRWGPPVLLISPSLILLGIFVYGLLISNFVRSTQDVKNLGQLTGALPSKNVGLQNYSDLLRNDDFQHSLRNLLIYTVVFLAGTLFFGFLWAWLLDRKVKFEGVFRSVYLFPMAVSFIASSVVWRWLLNLNQDEKAFGLNRLFQIVHLDFLQNSWWNNTDWGITALTIPAIWQLSGYVMALFLAGFRGIPEELREAARIDGASELQMYRYVIFPQLSPVALSAVIIIGHMSLKAFDLIYGVANRSYAARVPAVDLYLAQTSGKYSQAAAIGSILLIIVAILVIPYLIHNAREDKR